MRAFIFKDNIHKFFKLFWFFFTSNLKTWSFYAYSGLFLFLWCFYIYIYPIIEDGKNLIEIFRYKHLLAFVILFLVVDIVSITVKVFSTSWYDGSELLVVTRPVSRPQIIWSKILVISIFIVTLAGITAISSIFTKFTPACINDVDVAITVGSFTAVIVVGFIFASLSILVALFMKPMNTVLTIVGIEAILLTLQVILNVMITSPGRTLRKQHDIKMDDVALVSNLKPNNELGYQQVAFMLKKNEPITQETRFNGVPLRVSYGDLAHFAQTAYYKEANSPKRNVITYLDIEKQWANLFMIYPQETLNKNPMLKNQDGGSIFNNIFNSSNESFYWSIQFNNLGMQEILDRYNATSIAKSKYKFHLLSNGSISLSEFKNGERDKTFFAYSNNPNYNGNFEFELTDLTFPIYEIDPTTQNWKLKTFKDYSEFGEYYFSNQYANCIEFKEVLDKVEYDQIKAKNSSFYTTLLVNWWQTENQLNLDKLINEKSNKELNSLQNLLFNFQYHTYKLLQNSFENKDKYPWLGQNELDLIYSILNFDTNNADEFHEKMESSIYLGQPNTLHDAMQKENFLKTEYFKNWYTVTSQLSIVPQDFLQTVTLVSVKPAINPVYTTIFWLIFSAIVFMVSVSLYARKDIL